MRRKLAPLLFEDHDRKAAAAARSSPVIVAEVSPAARAKALQDNKRLNEEVEVLRKASAFAQWAAKT